MIHVLGDAGGAAVVVRHVHRRVAPVPDITEINAEGGAVSIGSVKAHVGADFASRVVIAAAASSVVERVGCLPDFHPAYKVVVNPVVACGGVVTRTGVFIGVDLRIAVVVRASLS